jgi:Arabinose-binding domain of AraC transcription regulator, N-term
LSSANIVNDVDTKRLGTVPAAAGMIARLAYARARQAGIELDALLKKADLTEQQIADRGARFAVNRQIRLLNLAASALQDEFLGFHLAQQLPDLRELGMLYCVAASSDTLADTLRRTARYSSTVNEGLSIKCLAGERLCRRYADHSVCPR